MRVLALLKPRAKRLTEYVDGVRPFLAEPAEYDPEAVNKQLAAPGVAEHIRALREAFAAVLLKRGRSIRGVNERRSSRRLRQLAETRGVKAGTLIHATRIAMTGRMVSPGLFEMLVLLGRERVLARLDRLTEFLGRHESA